ncbi:MAG: TonB-dependent receptor [Sphingomonadaceae bacterium]|nr:TonB-dependent receptor [Sphingomonadaceae bacterium]
MFHARIASRLLAGTAIVAAGTMTVTAHAQDSGSGFGVNEIIVTAQKREQSIQDVPIAVSALGRDTIEANKIEDVSDLTGFAPGLVARQAAGAFNALNFSMRGVNAAPSAPLQDKQVSQYVDGVYIGGSRGTISELLEVERIEILRGPQGTLFGRNSTAGAVNILTRNPTGEMAFRQDVTYGNQDHLRTRTTIDTPQMGAFSAYATYIHDENRGDVRNLGAGVTWDRSNPFIDVGSQTSPKWVGGRNYENLLAAVRYDPGGDFVATYKFDWSRGSYVTDARVTPVINTMGERIALPDGSKTVVPFPNTLGTLLQSIINAQPPGGGVFGPTGLNPSNRRPDAANQAFATPGFQRVKGHNLTFEWRASDTITIKNILAYRENEVANGGSTVAGLSGLQFTPGSVTPYANFVGLSAGIPGFSQLATQAARDAALAGALGPAFLPGLNFIANSNEYYFAPFEGQGYGSHWQVSDEIQLNYSTDRLDLTVGALYYQARTKDAGLPGFTPNITFGPVSTTIPLGTAAPGIGAQYAVGKTKSYAAYAQIEYQLTDALGITAGGRWTKDDKYGIFQSQGAFVGDRITEGTIVYPDENTFEGSFKKSRLTYALGLNFQPTDDMLFYAKYSTGFLSGGIYADIPFRPETSVSWEAGAKLDLLDRRVRLNLAAYKVDYKNAQAASSGPAILRRDLPIAVISNGKLKAKGIEADLTLAPFEGFTTGGTIGYTKNSFTNPDPRLADGYDDLKPTGQPKYVGTVFGQYVSQPLWGDATLLLRADMIFQSKARVLSSHKSTLDFPVFAPFEFSPAKQIVNARIALRDIEMGGANWEIALWSKNLLDNKKPLYLFQYPYFLMTSSYERARTYGIDLSVKFGAD